MLGVWVQCVKTTSQLHHHKTQSSLHGSDDSAAHKALDGAGEL